MTDFIWPSDLDRAENDELNRVCEYLEEVLEQQESTQCAEPVAWACIWPDGSWWGATQHPESVETWMRRADEGRTVRPLIYGDAHPQPVQQGGVSEPTILRKQAEAVEPAIRTALRNLGNADLSEEDIDQFAFNYAQRLRQRADELESGE